MNTNFQNFMRGKKSKSNILTLPGSTQIEVVAVAPGKDPIKKEMTIDEANNIPKRRGWKYHRFQLGFSSFTNLKK